MLLVLCGVAAAAAMYLAFSSNAVVQHSLPQIDTNLRIAGALGAFQVLCCLLIWRFFVITRRRFARRLQAATGGMNDRIFLADANGTPRALLAGAGWIPRAPGDWLETIHPDDRVHWPMGGATEPQRMEIRINDGGEWRWHRLRATPVRDPGGDVHEWMITLHDIHEQKLASEHRDLVIEELRHRLKNLVTVIDALAKNSRRPKTVEPGVETYLQRFLGRLHALGAAGDLVLAGNRISVEAGAIVKATLAPFMSENAQRIYVAGPQLLLTEELGSGLGLAVHELATNALKYGSLSAPDGRVSFTWSVTPAGGAQNVMFEWKETGGPEPTPPAKPGFGTNVIKHVVVREKSGRVDIEYPADGLTCRIAFLRDFTNGAGKSI
ncbi:MAG TPA: HWE histidine kinase domain-containing protein [Rhizomicrobium sp.]|nr:HWE histidine kinase domain-containing protein [Rhizomicrobium sp.]